MTVLDVFSWLPAKEISIEELEQIFIKHLNGTYEGEYKVLLEIPDNADKNILSSSAELIGERKAVAYILKDGNVIAVVGYKE
ncbi:MAG: hypothetical protein K1W20_07070 [Lachnospiraceae bacterium]|jgi:hypothetical protein|uniref:Uncharacterized protein n=1 Tax=Sporofaciens musculi TaxID=2681861 RepID=A0A7X3ML49_9FIRM|nr:hypothetical protein [Sporofaciens musculi]MXP78428.1 hypothetical protein [Sporofaciens musculi]